MCKQVTRLEVEHLLAIMFASAISAIKNRSWQVKLNNLALIDIGF